MVFFLSSQLEGRPASSNYLLSVSLMILAASVCVCVFGILPFYGISSPNWMLFLENTMFCRGDLPHSVSLQSACSSSVRALD